MSGKSDASRAAPESNTHPDDRSMPVGCADDLSAALRSRLAVVGKERDDARAELQEEKAILAHVLEQWSRNGVIDWEAVDDDVGYGFVESMTRNAREWNEMVRKLERAVKAARIAIQAARPEAGGPIEHPGQGCA